MSRLYGKSSEVYSISKLLVDSNIKPHTINKKRISNEELETCPEKIEIYLPDKAIEIISNTPIRIVFSPLAIKDTCLLPKNKTEEPTMYFSRWNPIEENKRELVLFLGQFLSSNSLDRIPDDNTIPCEFNELISLLLEAFYLKEEGKLEEFSNKHLNELLFNAKRYVESYKNYNKYHDSLLQTESLQISEKERNRIEEKTKKIEKEFSSATLSSLTPLSSMEVALQIIDKNEDKEKIKELLELLIDNPLHDRQTIIKDMGYETYGYKRLRKEIERRRV